MKARIIDQRVRVYGTMDINSLSISELVAGNEVELGAVKKKGGETWVAVTLPTGQQGYISGKTRVFRLKLATLLQNEAKVYAEPSEQSSVKTQYKKNAKFQLTDIVSQDNKNWVKIRDASGTEGFIDGKTRIKIIPVITKAVGRRNMIYGALWCIGGILLTVISYSAASSGGTYVITWGAIFFGVIQFIQGLYQFLRSPS